MIAQLFSVTALIGIATAGIRLATSYCTLLSERRMGKRSGLLNLGVDGIMLMGAYAAFFTTFKTGSLALGLLVAIVVGGIMGLAMAFFSVTLKAEQGISGIGVYLFGLGMSNLLFRKTLGTVETVSGFPPIHFPIISDIPVIGPLLFSHNLLVYGAFALVPISWFVLNKTTLGLKIRAVGENPEADDSLGVSVERVRYFAETL